MKNHRTTSHKNAFSLVELSIVLVILGLLVGGVLSGQSLIRAAELRSVSTEYQRYTTAIGTFREKYFAIPGDMSNAVSFWGNTDTGNGDGDGTIESTGTAIGAAGALTSNEISNFWIHLTKAALVEGSYTAIANTTLTAPTNNPKAKLSNAAWNVGTLGSVANTSVVYFEGSYGNVFYFGSGTAAAAPTAALKPEEAWNLDTKLDDGRPDIGTVTTLESQGLAAGTACSSITAAATTLAASSYSLTNASSACSLVFKTGY
jgi:prepilin-type N-terminal cleavage/methylation domain-containing protein